MSRPEYIEIPDIPENIEREMQRLHNILQHFGPTEIAGRWAMDRLDELHSLLFGERPMVMRQEDSDLLELGPRA